MQKEVHSGEWKEYAPGVSALNVKDPQGYCVYFKVVDNTGNHNDLFSYFSVHIAHEQLTIKLFEEARKGFEAGVEYGDFNHTQSSFETLLESGIASITDNLGAEKREDFIKNIANFTFYLRKDSEDGEVYTVEDDGVYLSNGHEYVANLPLGTYFLYVAYTGEDVGSGEDVHITFIWEGGRPSFEVTARKITIALTFKSHVYGETPADWVKSGTPVRTTAGAGGSWYAPGEENVDLELDFSLRGAGMPSAATNAGIYHVVAAWGNANYEVTFVNAAGGELTYTVEKASVGMPDEDGTEFIYTGVQQTYHVESNPLYEVRGNVQTNANADGYDVTIRLSDPGNYQWTGGGSEDLIYKFIIGKATLTVTARGHEITYGDLPSNGERSTAAL